MTGEHQGPPEDPARPQGGLGGGDRGPARAEARGLDLH